VSRADCVFCRIADGDLPAHLVFENGCVVAFHDANPQAPVHVLVIPREHYANLQDAVPAELLAEVFLAVREVAEATGVARSGYRVIANAGPDSNQTVDHLHVHVLGGQAMSHGMVNPR
jgi:histidine triad (HIT) family protein